MPISIQRTHVMWNMLYNPKQMTTSGIGLHVSKEVKMSPRNVLRSTALILCGLFTLTCFLMPAWIPVAAQVDHQIAIADHDRIVSIDQWRLSIDRQMSSQATAIDVLTQSQNMLRGGIYMLGLVGSILTIFVGVQTLSGFNKKSPPN